MNWYEDGACRSADPELFFPPSSSGPEIEAQVEEARAICGRCVVRETCLAYAVANDEVGIWGGTTDAERRRLSGYRDRLVHLKRGAVRI